MKASHDTIAPGRNWFKSVFSWIPSVEVSKKRKMVLLIGFDGVGKTTLLYSIKSPEAEVRTSGGVDELGLNVEVLEASDNSMSIISWELRQLNKATKLRWNSSGREIACVIFVIDSTDKDRFDLAKEEFHTFLNQETSKAPILIIANKQDDPSATSCEALLQVLAMDKVSDRRWHIFPTCLCTDSDINCILPNKLVVPINVVNQWLTNVMDGNYSCIDLFGHGVIGGVSPQEDQNIHQSEASQLSNDVIQHEIRKRETLWQMWRDRIVGDDEEFLAQLTSYQLDSWDHYTHVRLAWIYITRLDIQSGYNGIEKTIYDFVNKSSNTIGKSFHPTLTRFWCHMIAYWMIRKKIDDLKNRKKQETFESFLLFVHKNRDFYENDIINCSLFKYYYTSNRIFSQQARSEMVRPNLRDLPDIRPLLKILLETLRDPVAVEKIADDLQYMEDSDYWLHWVDDSA